jgi:hypothetical protein
MHKNAFPLFFLQTQHPQVCVWGVGIIETFWVLGKILKTGIMKVI